jgi:hypothetical protein
MYRRQMKFTAEYAMTAERHLEIMKTCRGAIHRALRVLCTNVKGAINGAPTSCRFSGQYAEYAGGEIHDTTATFFIHPGPTRFYEFV